MDDDRPSDPPSHRLVRFAEDGSEVRWSVSVEGRAQRVAQVAQGTSSDVRREFARWDQAVADSYRQIAERHRAGYRYAGPSPLSPETIRVDLICHASMARAIDAMARHGLGPAAPFYQLEITDQARVPIDVVARLAAIGDAVATDGEITLALTAVGEPRLRARLRALVDEVVISNRAAGAARFVDDERTVGAHPAWALALHDRADVARYLALLRTLDLDHEIQESVQIDHIVTTHGWCAETIALVAARAGSCAGRHGVSQVAGFLDGPIGAADRATLVAALERDDA